MCPSSTRRGFLLAAAGALASTLPPSARSTAAPQDRLVIVNADDLGKSAEIDRGILEAHDRGIVTSASLLVEGASAEAAVEQVRRRPRLGLGIHVAFDTRIKRWLDAKDMDAIQREIDRQLDRFVAMTSGPPDHIDSHHHVHRLFNVSARFLDAGRRYRVPVRGFGEVVFLGQFWAQPELGKTDLSRVGVEALTGLLRSLGPGVFEISCHPGYAEARPELAYNREREVELRTLTDPRIPALMTEEGIRLINYRDYARVRSARVRS